MSDIFAGMARVLHEDAAIGVDADYRAGGQGPAVSMRIVRDRSSAVAGSFGSRIRVTNDRAIFVLAADCTPAKGDTWTLADETTLTALDPELDETGTEWKVAVR